MPFGTCKVFGIDDVLLSGDTAQEVWDRANEVLSSGLSARKCMLKSRVETVCTTDDPTSELEYHKKIAEEPFGVKVLPTFRPDKAFAIDGYEKYIEYLNSLEQATNMEIKSYDDLLNALKRRHDYFHSIGCRVSDYGIDTVWYKDAFYYEVEDTFKKAISSPEEIAPEEALAFKSAILLECAAMDYDSGWVRQLHIGPIRNNNSSMFKSSAPTPDSTLWANPICVVAVAPSGQPEFRRQPRQDHFLQHKSERQRGYCLDARQLPRLLRTWKIAAWKRMVVHGLHRGNNPPA